MSVVSFHPIHAEPVTPAPVVVWVTCGYCAGQRQIYTLTLGGLTVGPDVCPRCGGIGETA